MLLVTSSGVGTVYAGALIYYYLFKYYYALFSVYLDVHILFNNNST